MCEQSCGGNAEKDGVHISQDSSAKAQQCSHFHMDSRTAHELVYMLINNVLHVPATIEGSNYKCHKSEALGFETLSLTAEAGLSVLHDLVMHSPSTPNGFGLSNTELVNIVVFTNCHDPWTTDKAACDASRILALLLPGDKMSDFLVGNILQGLLRPIFSNSSSTVPASLRLSHPQDSRSARQGVVEHLAWKHPNPQTVSIFRWAVQMANVSVVAANWSFFTPVLFALIEDQEPSIREEGLQLMILFLKKVPLQTLKKAGISTLIQEAIFPILPFLSLNTESESVKLLSPAYEALLILAQLDTDTQRRRLLDRLIRAGILKGYYNAPYQVRVVELLMHKTTAIIKILGISSSRHLQSLLRVFSSVMTTAFAKTCLPVIAAAAEALNTAVISCWPRFVDTQLAEQVLCIITTCWQNFCEGSAVGAQQEADPTQICLLLKEGFTLLNCIRSQRILVPPGTIHQILTREPQLADLLLRPNAGYPLILDNRSREDYQAFCLPNQEAAV